MDNINAPNYDRVIAIEEYVDKICQILDRREIQYTVIESMVLPELNSKNIEPFVTNE